jgi:hypothetical protein
VNALLVLPVVCGVLLAFGQFFMKQVAISLPAMVASWSVIRALVLSPFLYLFLLFNVAATVTYIGSLRFMTMSNTFAVVFVTMGATVLCLDLLVNKITLLPINLAGVALAVVAVILIGLR